MQSFQSNRKNTANAQITSNKGQTSASLEKSAALFSPFLAKALEGDDFLTASYCQNHQ